MPPLNMINILADLYFVGQNKKIPVQWKQPQGQESDDGKAKDKASNYANAFTASEKVGIPEPLCYFWPASTNKLHVDSCKEIGGRMKEFVHNMLSAIKEAHDIWRFTAHFKDLKIMSLSAIGTAGCLSGPKLAIKTMPSAMKMSTWGDNIQKWIDAVHDGVSDCFEQWQKKVMVPGLPWYPAFVAFPGPVAPPVPNVPMPLFDSARAAGPPSAAPFGFIDRLYRAIMPRVCTSGSSRNWLMASSMTSMTAPSHPEGAGRRADHTS